MRYSFLVLSLLFLLPGALVYALRRDLRRAMTVTAAFSLPFALTEFLFYPTYWEPQTLFDLVPRVGFGIEDLLFVAGLGMLTVGVYPAVFGLTFEAGDAARAATTPTLATRDPAPDLRRVATRAGVLLGATALAVTGAALAGVHMIYAAPAIMVVAAGVVGVRRHDLVVPSLAGGALTLAVYGGLSLVFAELIPGVFELEWNTELFLDRYILGIPVEELLYGFTAGLVGSVFYPYVTGRRFVRIRGGGAT